MFHVEKMEVADLPFAVQLANTMNWNMTPADFEFNMKLEPDGCFVLFHDQKRLGIATSISYSKLGWFGNLIVKEDARRKGAGKLLVKYTIERLKSKGAETIGLYAYPHLIEFYASLGFETDLEFSVLKGKIAMSSIAQENLRKATIQDIPEMVAFDSKCFGANRQKLLEAILIDTGNLCYVTNENSLVSGYVAAKVNGEMAEIGPLVCRASHEKEAVLLLKTMQSRLNGYECFVYIPKKEHTLLEVAKKAGLKEAFRVVRMFLGSAVDENCICAAESLERG